jgi:hypothetical protein
MTLTPATFSDKRRSLRYRLNALCLRWSRAALQRGDAPAPSSRPISPAPSRKLVADTIESLRLWRPPVLAGDEFSSHLLRDDLHRFLAALATAARAHDLRLAVFLSPRKYRFMPLFGARQTIRRATRGANLHIALIDRARRLCLVHELIPWKADGDGFVAVADDVPHKRMRHTAIAVPKETDMAPAFPIDAVYTWVDSGDPAWRRQFGEHAGGGAPDADRFSQRDELRYSLRSLDLYAPWLRRVFVFSNCRPPAWFRPSDRYRWVRHEEVVESRYLPSFNSHAIETFLHTIPELSDRFIYLNDDFFLSDWVNPADFFDATGRSVSRLEPYGVNLHHEQLLAEGIAKEWQAASVNGARLLRHRFGIYPLRLHCHVPYALSRSVYEEIEREFPEEIEATRLNRFRRFTDISVTSFLYHHYALLRGHAVPAPPSDFIADGESYHRFTKELRKGTRYKFICVNDGRNSAHDPAFNHFKDHILPLCFPFGSGAEG